MIMDVPIEIKTAVKDLADFIRARSGPDNVNNVHDRAMQILRKLWDVREQIPTPEHSAKEYITDLEREYIRDYDSLTQPVDRSIAQCALWGEKLIGNALDRYLTGTNVWNYHVNQDAVDISWVEPIVDRVIERLRLTPRNLKRIGAPKQKFPYIVELELTPLRGSQVFEEEVEDLTAEQQRTLANLMKYQGLPGDTTAGILASLYVDITHVPATEFAELGAVCGLFYAVWRRLKQM